MTPLQGSPNFKKNNNSVFQKAPKQIRQANMSTGAYPRNDYERVTRSMFDNQRRDTVPSMRTLTGQEQKVMNLRPLDKSQHLDDPQFRNCSLKTSIERI